MQNTIRETPTASQLLWILRSANFWGPTSPCGRQPAISCSQEQLHPLLSRLTRRISSCIYPRPTALISPPLTSQVKAANHLLEVEHPIRQGGKHYDKNAPGQLRRATQKHTGSRSGCSFYLRFVAVAAALAANCCRPLLVLG